MNIHPTTIMKTRIQAALLDQAIRDHARQDLAYTLGQLGLDDEAARQLARSVTYKLRFAVDLEATEREIYKMFGSTRIDGVPLTEIIDDKMSGRAEKIFLQVSPYFEGIKPGEPVLDFGCGDAQVTKLMRDRLNLTMRGCDVVNYVASDARDIPFFLMDNECRVPASDAYFSAVLMTNVLHHEADNRRILAEIARILKPGGSAVVIETVPEDSSPAAFERNFLNDYFYNRLFHQANIAVPGTYETEEDWVPRFQEFGFELASFRNLGYDQPTIRDIHVLYDLRLKRRK